jgi:uncharacterized Zn finger protein
MPRQRAEPPEPTGWARLWLDAIMAFDPQNAERLQRGIVDARRGMVLEEAVYAGEVRAAVARPTVYQPVTVTIEIATFSDEDWRRVAAAFAARADLAARLLAGEVPLELRDVLAPLGLALEPQHPSEIAATCTCRQGHKLCPHVAAAHYILATNLEQVPALLFTLRGRELEIALDDMRARWAGGQPASAATAGTQADAAERPPLEPLRAEHFYRAGPALDALRFTIAPPQVEAALLKRLGRPPFAAPEEDPIPALIRVYELVTRRTSHSVGRAERQARGRA